MDLDTNAGNNTPLKQQTRISQQSRTLLRQQKLRYTFIGYIIVLCFLAITQFIGVGLFTKGYLLSRHVLPNIAECGVDSCIRPAKYDKMVFLVIDALRFDFTIPVPESNQYYHNNFPILYDLAQTDSGVLLKFMADPPTTTLQRLKGLTTGSLPTFIDAGSNFNGDHIDEDNWLLQLRNLNKTIAFMGDDTWTALFEDYIDVNLNFPYDSLNVWDLHTVDNGVIEHLYPLIHQHDTWDVLIGHFLGVDHVGHRYGPNHFTMKEKLNQMNQVIEQVVANLDENTLLVVIGDHGMDSTGNHGGDAPDELESTLFMYSKTGKFLKPNDYDIKEAGKNYHRVNQIDLVPTISSLLGLPIPYNNLGFPIEEAFSSAEEVLTASYNTIKQLKQFRDDTPNLAHSLLQQYETLIQHYNNNTVSRSLVFTQFKQFQELSLDQCKGLWARFDLRLISIGIGILFLAVTFMITYSRSIPSVRVSTMSFEFIGSVIAMTMLGLVLSFSIYFVLKPNDFNLVICLAIGSALGMVIGFWAPIMDRFSINFLWNQIMDFFKYNFNSWSFMGILFVILHCLIFASNSYVVWEDKLVSFFLLTFGIGCIYTITVNTQISQREKILGLSHAITFTLMTRLVSMINLCREEQRPYCQATFMTTWWSVVLLHVVSFILPMFIASFYKLSDSYHSAATLWIGTGLSFLLFMNAVYWTFEYVQNNEYFNQVSSGIGLPLIKSLKLAIARLVLFITLVLANFSWSRGPLCVKLELSQESMTSSEEDEDEAEDESEEQPQQTQGSNKTATILGYGNVYGSSYFLLVLNFTVAIMLTNKPIGAISISMLIIQILSLLELNDTLSIRKNLISPIIFGLLGYQHFFSTGHQATIPSIQWELGFMTTETIFMPFTHLNIVLNTFGPFFIVCLSLPLITLWRIVPSNKPITVLSQIITNVTTFITYQLFTGLTSLIFAAHFRRHLMVWKVFAPRFMLSGLLIIVLNVFLIVVTLWFGVAINYNSSFTPDHLEYLRQETKSLFNHGWDSYMTYGFPADEVTPISCRPYGPDFNNNMNTGRNDALGNVSSTVLDNLDSLIIMEQWQELEYILDYLKFNQATIFNQDTIVQVFELTIRSLGGLLSAHLLLTDVTNLGPRYDKFTQIVEKYDGFLLSMAYDLGLRLIPSYKTKTNIPVPRINLARGLARVPPALQRDACTSGATTPVLEFTLLSRLTGDLQFEYYTQLTFWKLWSSKSRLHLLPMTIDPLANHWKDSITGIGASIDSFYEYSAKAAILFNDDYMWSVFKTSYQALLTHSALFGGPRDGIMIFPNVNTEDGSVFGDWIDSLGAFWPGLQVLTGQLTDAIKTHAVYLKIWDYFDSIPERWVYFHLDEEVTNKKPLKSEDSIALEWYPLRPEFIESTYYLYRATKDPMYLQIGERVLNLFRDRYKTLCGFSGLQDVRTGERQDRMETFVLGETLKYLYLLFDTNDEIFLHDEKVMGGKNWIFSTEAHPLWLNKKLDLFNMTQGSVVYQEQRQEPLSEVPSFVKSSVKKTNAEILNTPISPFLRNMTLASKPDTPITGNTENNIIKKDPFGTRFDMCELSPWSNRGFLESGYYTWDYFFHGDYQFEKSLMKPVYIPDKGSSDGSNIELTHDFYEKFTMSIPNQELYLQCSRPATTKSYEVLWGDIKLCNQIEISRLDYNSTSEKWPYMVPGDFWIPEIKGLKLTIEELKADQVDTRNIVITKDWIDSMSEQQDSDTVLRINRVNGIYVDSNTVIWTMPFEVTEQDKGQIEINSDLRIVIQGRVVENLLVWYG
ncbi:GPI ethanolamine phosphate transferase 3 [Spathaspora sp. JA1]|nr:GPI ethanolamine phosphate transferase 3 [Spathaspora sp. JA1]